MALSGENNTRLEELYEELLEKSELMLGYPCTGRFDYSDLYRFLQFTINNVGDPFIPSNYGVNSRELECEVLKWFADLHHAPEDDYWGYVTSGGTEGNMYGLYMARELFPDGIVYYSEDTHYSVSKNLHVLKMRSIMIKSQKSGEIDYEDLFETIRIHRDVPPIIFANIGTTMKQAVDDVERIREFIKENAIPSSYIHCDAAFSGMILPFIDDGPVYDFRADTDSVSISGHKLIGSPVPCGIVLTKRRYVERIKRSIEYVGALDTTLAGSRSGISPLILWYAIRKNGVEGFRRIVSGCLEMADYAIAELGKIGVKAWRNPHGITVVFPRPPEPVQKRWMIAVKGEIGHLITVPSVREEQIDAFVAELDASLRESPKGAES
jgi:histidine decarboxylase